MSSNFDKTHNQFCKVYVANEKKTDTFFSNEKDCKEHMEFFNNMPKPGTMTSRCITSTDEGWWNKKDTI